MCKYCNPEREFLEEDEFVNSLICHRDLKNGVYEGLEIGIDKDKLSIFAVIPLKVGFSTVHASYTKNLDIKYCPMCGRRLDGKVDLDRMTAAENKAYWGTYG